MRALSARMLCKPPGQMLVEGASGRRRIWLFDLDDTLHDAREAAFSYIDKAMTAYIVRKADVSEERADTLRLQYWRKYGATLTGLVRHHGIDADDFLRVTHVLPGLEERLRVRQKELRRLRALPGEKWVYTNGPRAYALRVLKATGIKHVFSGVWAIENTRWRGEYHPKPDRRALRRLLARLHANPTQCVLIDDSPINLNTAKRLGLAAVWMQGFHTPKEKRALRRRFKSAPKAVIHALDGLTPTL